MSDSPVAAAVEAVKANLNSEVSTPAATATDAPAQPNGRNADLDAFARKERQLRKMQQELQAERESFKRKETEYSNGYIAKTRFNEDPLGALQDAGISYEKLTELLLQNPNSNDPTIRALRSEINALKQSQETASKQAEEQNTVKYQAAVKQIDNEVKMLIDRDANFETIKQSGMADAVTQLIVDTFEAEGYVMDVLEAAKEVENHLVEEAYKLAQLSKVQSRLKPATPEPIAPPAQKQSQSPQVTTKTLTNAVTQEAPKRSSDKERRERALAAFYGKLG
jgi:hypothetical protein